MRKLTWAGLTDVGRKRTENEDAFVVDPDLGIYVVCDGMGGHASGEVASAMTTEEIHAFFQTRLNGDRSLPYSGEPGATAGELVVSNAIQHANDKVYIAGMRDSKLEGMGTTVVAVSEWQDKLILAHVGDSRIYRFRDGRLEQVTRDHSLLNHKIDLGELTTQEEIDNFKHGNVIVRAIGLKDYVRPETSLHDRMPGDVYILCSDGLSDMVDDWSIENVIEANRDDLEEAAQILVRMANDRGGKDNITAVLVRVDDEPEEEEAVAEEEEELTYHERQESTAPGMKAVDEESEESEEDDPGVRYKDITDDAEETTAPHSPVFAWADDEDEEEHLAEEPTLRPNSAAPTKTAPRPNAASRTATTEKRLPAAEQQRRQNLPSIIVDDDEPSVVVDDHVYKR